MTRRRTGPRCSKTRSARCSSGPPDLDRILALFPRTQGPAGLRSRSRSPRTSPSCKRSRRSIRDIRLLDLSVKTGLAHIDATFRGDHPKYGVGTYAQEIHDGFPPTIIAAVDALSAWGLNRRAAQLFRYWLTTFVKDDGGHPLLRAVDQRVRPTPAHGRAAGRAGRVRRAGGRKASRRWIGIAEYVLRLRAAAAKEDGLLVRLARSGHAQGHGQVLPQQRLGGKGTATLGRSVRTPAGSLRRLRSPPSARSRRTLAADTLRAIREDLARRSGRLVAAAAGRAADKAGTPDRSLGRGVLHQLPLLAGTACPAGCCRRTWPTAWSRHGLTAGGQFCGMTRFAGHLDDWPLAEYLYGLWSLGRKNDFLLSLYGHVAYHQAEGHLTAYEQVSFPPGQKMADYCLPCQLVAARAARLLTK